MTKKEERQAIFDKTNGRCGYCGDPLQKGWHKDHMEPIGRESEWDRKGRKFRQTGVLRKPENDNFENLLASCPKCNLRKGSSKVDMFRYELMNTIDSLNRDSSPYRFAKQYGLLKETGIKIVFYFETLKL